MSEENLSSRRTKKLRRFDPVVFLETAAKGRTISTHQKKEIIFSQGNVADAVFYIKGQSQSHRRFQARQGSGGCNPGSGRICR
jgi:hypothetical protein